MKYLAVLLVLSSCTTKTVVVDNNKNSSANEVEPNKEKALSRILKAVEPNNKGQFYFVEINNIPQPFDVAGVRPYVLWINGERIKNVPMDDLRQLVNKVSSEVTPFKPKMDIHAGWLTPHFVPHSRIQRDFPPLPRVVKKDE